MISYKYQTRLVLTKCVQIGLFLLCLNFVYVYLHATYISMYIYMYPGTVLKTSIADVKRMFRELEKLTIETCVPSHI